MRTLLIVFTLFPFLFTNTIDTENCDCAKLNDRKVTKFNTQREKLVGIWTRHKLNQSMIIKVVESGTASGRKIGYNISMDKPTSLDTVIKQIEKYKKSFEGRNYIEEMRKLECLTYCYFQLTVKDLQEFQIILNKKITSDRKKTEIEKKMKTPFATEEFYQILKTESDFIAVKYNLSNWRPTEKEIDAYINGK